jgi:hypothetical protein
VATSIIRPGLPDDLPKMAVLMEDAGLRPNSLPADLQWKYWQQRVDWPGPRSYVMVRDGQLLAHAAVVPGTYHWQSRRVRTRHVIDWAARSNAPGAGVSLLKFLGQDADALLAIGGSAQTLGLLPHLGFRRCGAVTGFVRPLHPLRLLTTSVHSTWRVPPRLLRSMLWALQAPRGGTQGWQVSRVTVDQLPQLAPVLPVSRNDFATPERSPEWFRYALDCPIAAMSLFVMQQAGRVRGYFLLAFALRQARLADCWMDSEDAADWRALIQCVVREANRHPQAAELAVWGSDPLFSRCLRECGFRERSEFPVQMLATREASLLPTRLRVQMLDNDAAYRHTGRNEFWA